MSDLKGTAIRAAKEVVGKSVEQLLDPEAIKKAAAELASGKEKVDTNADQVKENLEATHDRKVIGTIGQMADLIHMGEDEKAKAVWDEMKHGVGLEKKKLWGWVDRMGEWSLKKAIKWGILPKSFVAMMVGKKKLRETTSAEGGAVAKAKGALEGLKNEAEGIKEKVEGAKDRLAEWPERFAFMKSQAQVVITEWKGFLSDTGGKQMLEGLTAVEKRIAEIDFSQLSPKTREALMSLWSKDEEKIDPKQVLLLVGEEIKEMRDMGIYVEFKESFNKDPKLKANNLSWKGLHALRSYLEKKGVSKAELEKYDGLVRAMNLSDYQATDPEHWAALMDYVNGLQVNGQAVGCQLEVRDGYYQMLDYSTGNFEHEVLGFARTLPPEKILSLPSVFFGNLAIIKSVENTHELAHAFLDNFSTAVGDTAPKTKQAIAKIRNAVDRGELDWDKFLTRPDSSTKDLRHELFDALKQDIAGGGLLVAISKGGYIAFRTAAGTYWSYFQISAGSLLDGMSQAWNTYWIDGNTLGSAGKAFANEYLSGAAPMIALYGTGTVANMLLHGKMNPWTLAKGLGKALVAPVSIVYDTGKVVIKGTVATYHAAKWGYEMYQGRPEALARGKLWRNYYLSDVSDEMLLRCSLPPAIRFKLFGDSLNNALVDEIGYLSHRLGYLQEVERLAVRGDLPLTEVKHSLATEREALEAAVKKYVLTNFEPVSAKGLRNRFIRKPTDAKLVTDLTEDIVKDYHGKWLANGRVPLRMEEVEVRLNELVAGRTGMRVTTDRYGLVKQKIDDLEHEKARRVKTGGDVGSVDDEIRKLRTEFQVFSPEVERLYTAGEELDKAIKAKNPGDIARHLDEVKRLEGAAFDEGMKRLEGDAAKGLKGHVETLRTKPDIQAFNDVMDASVAEERKLGDLISRRVRWIEQMRAAGVQEHVLQGFAQETEQLANRFVKIKVASLTVLDEAYKVLRKGQGVRGLLPLESNAAFLRMRQNYRRFIMHNPGGMISTRMFRTAKTHALTVAPIMLLGLYMKYRETVEQDPDAGIIKLFRELGPETVQMVADMWSPAGVSDWYTVYTGKEFFTNREVGGVNRYVVRPLFGFYQVATQALALGAGVLTFEAGGAGGVGVEAAAGGIRAALTAAGKADRIAEIMRVFPRVYQTAQECGGAMKFAERVKVVAGRFASGKLAWGVKGAAGVAQTAGNVAALGDIAYQTIGGFTRPVAYAVSAENNYQPSKEVQEDIMSPADNDPTSIQPIPQHSETNVSGEQKSFNPQTS